MVHQAHLYVTKRGHVSARCRLSPEEELLVLDKATKVAGKAALEAAEETAKEAATNSTIGEQAGRYCRDVREATPDEASFSLWVESMDCIAAEQTHG